MSAADLFNARNLNVCKSLTLVQISASKSFPNYRCILTHLRADFFFENTVTKEEIAQNEPFATMF